MAVHLAYTCITIYTSLFKTELNVSDNLLLVNYKITASWQRNILPSIKSNISGIKNTSETIPTV